MRRSFGALLLAAAVGVAVLTVLAAFGLTREYGYSPNDDPAQDLTRTALSHAVAALLVAALALGGLELATRLPRRRRARWAVGAFGLTFVLLAGAVALGQRSLDERCAGADRSSTGAC